jgi:hypothetical protein
MHQENNGHPQDAFVIFMLRENEIIQLGGSFLCVLVLVPPRSISDTKKL